MYFNPIKKLLFWFCYLTPIPTLPLFFKISGGMERTILVLWLYIYILHITLLITYLKLFTCDVSSPIEGMKWRSAVLLLMTGSGCDALLHSFNLPDNTIIFALFYLFYVFSKPMLHPLGHSIPQCIHLQNGNKNPWSESCIRYWACIIAAQADKGYYCYFYTFSFCNSPVCPHSSQRQFLSLL